jgi:hypothetical protein
MQQTSTVPTPRTPEANTPPITGGVAGTAQAPPRTAQGVQQLRAQRSELSDQLTSAVGRRNKISTQLRTAPLGGADRAGLEQQLAVLDKRITQLESDIAETGRLLISAPGPLLNSTQSAPYLPSPSQLTAISIVGTIFVLAPLSFAVARLVWRRATHPSRTLPPAPDITNRLDRMEQGIEAIAIEIERISEGQRFVTNLIGEQSARALGPGGKGREPDRPEPSEGVHARA